MRDLFSYNKMKIVVCRERLSAGKIDILSVAVRSDTLNSRWRVDQLTVTDGSLAQVLRWLYLFYTCS